MPEGPPSSGNDETLTPSQAIALAPTSATAGAPRVETATGTLPARYRLGGTLGAGGMGEVLLATDNQIEREVAIKRMRTVATEDALARFVREAKIQGRLDHPAIVPVHELATDSEGKPFFVMKRLTGRTLAERIADRSLSRQRLLRAFADVCLAIEFAHSRGVIHRDLKPANIMLGDFGEVYVLDWGVARLVDEHIDSAGGDAPTRTDDGATQAGTILGTPGYLAPELLRGESVDRRADVYALGCILFELLAREPLLPRGQAGLDAALAEVDARPSQRNADVPPELDQLCVAATTADAARRPSARELAEAVERFLDGDRDLALRQTLASQHLAAAHEALARGDDETARATAMREAGRALALTPRDGEAAALIGRMMLEPPREVPAAVNARVAELEEANGRAKVRLTERVVLSMFLFVPTSIYMGLRSIAALGVFLIVTCANLALTSYTARKRSPLGASDLERGWLVWSVLLAVMGWMFSPFLLAPAIATASVLLFSIDPRTNWRRCAAVHIAAVLGPWLLENVGVFAPTMRAVGGDLVLHSIAIEARMPAIAIGLAFFATVLILLAAFVASRIALAGRTSMRAIELQAWHLRQLVPRDEPA